MSNKNIEIIKTPSGWGVRREGALKSMKSFPLRGQAINYGSTLAKSNNTKLIVSTIVGRSDDEVFNPYKRKM